MSRNLNAGFRFEGKFKKKYTKFFLEIPTSPEKNGFWGFTFSLCTFSGIISSDLTSASNSRFFGTHMIYVKKRIFVLFWRENTKSAIQRQKIRRNV